MPQRCVQKNQTPPAVRPSSESTTIIPDSKHTLQVTPTIHSPVRVWRVIDSSSPGSRLSNHQFLCETTHFQFFNATPPSYHTGANGTAREEPEMKERTTQALLAIVAILLGVHLFRTAPMVATARADEAEPVPAVLRARMIELVDERGQVRANLKVEPDGAAVFRLRDGQGAIRVKLGATADGSGLLLLDDRTEPAVHLLAEPAGTTLTLTEKGKEKRVIRP
jgi:hypothetical protein